VPDTVVGAVVVGALGVGHPLRKALIAGLADGATAP
jgi:hypothetical protein